MGSQALKIRDQPKLHQKRFATGMNGDEDLGLDMVVKGTPVHIHQQQSGGLPLCDGSNGVYGFDCVSSGHYPRKYEGTPYAPNGPPVAAASLAQHDYPKCDGSNGVAGIDCVTHGMGG